MGTEAFQAFCCVEGLDVKFSRSPKLMSKHQQGFIVTTCWLHDDACEAPCVGGGAQSLLCVRRVRINRLYSIGMPGHSNHDDEGAPKRRKVGTVSTVRLSVRRLIF